MDDSKQDLLNLLTEFEAHVDRSTIARATFPLPPTLNEQINDARSHWSQSASKKKRWTNKIAKLAIDLPKFPDKVWIEFHYAVKTFARDPDNISASRKYLMDGLIQAGVIRNDNLTVIQSPVLEYFEKGSVDSVTIVISNYPIILEARSR